MEHEDPPEITETGNVNEEFGLEERMSSLLEETRSKMIEHTEKTNIPVPEYDQQYQGPPTAAPEDAFQGPHPDQQTYPPQYPPPQ